MMFKELSEEKIQHIIKMVNKLKYLVKMILRSFNNLIFLFQWHLSNQGFPQIFDDWVPCEMIQRIINNKLKFHYNLCNILINLILI